MTHHQQNLILLLTLLIMGVMMISSTQASVLTRHQRAQSPPCTPCDTRLIPQEILTERLASTCMSCGILYGTAIEHCCVCYEEFTIHCKNAISRR
ncbi:hypothetical protein Btru_038640 [Bulinus truncatus]|nr:hypothetical protein Btru_038640 [Bulinus truncatus]